MKDAKWKVDPQIDNEEEESEEERGYDFAWDSKPSKNSSTSPSKEKE